MQKQKQKSIAKKRAMYIALALMLFVGAPVLGAILVQNFTQWDVVVDEPPIAKLQGADANYDGDNDDTTGYLQVNLGQTISNNDSTLGTPGSSDTNLSHEEITFTCFSGDRTYYTDVIQLDNTTVGEDWDVTLTVEADLNGNAAVSDTFTAGDADIWLFTSSGDSTTAITSYPNPGNYGSNADWMDAAAPNGAIQLEVVSGTMSVAQAVTGPFTIPAGEQRQLALVVDCGANMVDAETGTFRLTVASTPN
jgi:cytoskeletal protein RodZ